MTVAAVALVGLAGCGESARDRVDDYVKEANEAQRQSNPAFKRANKAYADLLSGKSKNPQKTIADTAAAEAEIKRARTRLAALAPPAEAERLHRRLLAYYDANGVLAHETTELANYQRRADAAIAPLGRSTKTLRRLSSIPDAGGQAAVLRGYTASVRSGLKKLRVLSPPPVLRPAHRNLTRRLQATQLSAGRLVSALSAADAAGVAENVNELRAATGSQQRPSVLRRSIRSYNRRYRDIVKALAAVRREQNKLDRDLD